MSPDARLPLLAHAEADVIVAWRRGEPIRAGRFLAEARALAARLAEGGAVVNLCVDRYRFALGLVAALLRGQTSLLPPNALPATLSALPATHGALQALADEPLPDAGLPVLPLHEPDVRDDAGFAVPDAEAALSAVCLLTSGSTGTPQPHAKPWGAMVLNLRAEAERLAEALGRPTLAGLTIVATVPPQHSYGLESSVLVALLGGAAFEAGRPFYPADIVDALESVPRPRALVTTPFHLKTLLRSGLTLPAVDLVVSATAPLSPQLAAEAERRCGGPLIEIYGCTEAGQVATRRTSQTDVWRCFGELTIRREPGPADDPEAERFIAEGGHVQTPTPLADVLQIVDARHFRLLGRANDLIHVAGKRSSLAHLNYQLNRIDGIDDGSFWLPDDVQDGVVRTVAFVVAPTRSAAQIQAALREHIEPAFLPRRIVHVDALPREATGKLTAGALRRFARERLGRGPAAS